MAKKASGKRSYSSAHTRRSEKARGSKLRGLLLALAAVVLLGTAFALLALRGSGDVTIFENAIGTIMKPLESAFSSVGVWIRDFTTDWRSYSALEEKYSALQVEHEQLGYRVSALEELELENERLSALLDASEDYSALDPIFAKVIARDPGQWFDTFSIDRGTSDGVTAGMSVVTGDGLVGYVYEAGLNYAKVMTIIDTRSAVACIVQRTRDNGVMRGEVTNSSTNAECYVYYLPNVNNITPGDVVLTSGTDSLYPKGLSIGEVIAVSRETSSEGSYIIVSPYVDFRHIEEVLVLRVVIETDETLPVLVTPTPAPYVTPTPTPVPTGGTLAPDASGAVWSYPTSTPDAGSTPAPSPTPIEMLPEDEWADS